VKDILAVHLLLRKCRISERTTPWTISEEEAKTEAFRYEHPLQASSYDGSLLLSTQNLSVKDIVPSLL
jgi:hypothetical protein